MKAPAKRTCARAPVRVDPAGGGTDAPPFCIEHGGAVVNFALRRYAYAAVDRLPPGSGVLLFSADLDAGAHAESAGALPAEGALAFLRAFLLRLVPPGESLLLATDSDTPPGSGLGGSGALGVAVVAALDRAFGRERSREETAAIANDIERRDLGFPGGSQDSYAAALGGAHLLEYIAGGGVGPRRHGVPPETLLALEARSLLAYTGAAHVSGNIHEDILRSYGEPASGTLAAMFALRDDARRMAEALTRADLDGYAEALGSSCRHLYELHPSCDSAEHRALLSAVEDCIAGGKTCGAGGGGFLLLAARAGRRREAIRRAEALGAVVWPLALDFQGVRTWSEEALAPAAIDAYARRIERR